MARKSRPLKFPPPPSVVSADVPSVLNKLRQFYEIGRQSLERYPGRLPQGAASSERTKYGLSPELIRKARAFADPERGYTLRKLDKLCQQCERGGYGLGHVHIIRLLPVPKDKRNAYQQQAIAQRWTCRQLEKQIRRDNPKREVPGRRPSAIADASDAYVRIRNLCRSWQGVWALLVEPPNEEMEATDQTVLAKVPEGIRRILDRTNRQMAKLDAAAGDELRRAQRKSAKRKR